MSGSALDFQLLFAALPAPQAVLAPDGTLLTLNAALTALLPTATDAQLVGQPISALLEAATAAGVRLAPAPAWAAALTTLQTGPAQVLTPPAGRELSAWQATLLPVRQSPGTGQPEKLCYILVSLLYVTPTPDAIDAAPAPLAYAPLLSEDIPQLLWTANADGLLNYANRHWYDYTGLAPIEAYGDGWLAAVHPKDRAATQAQWQQCLLSGASQDMLYRLRRAATGRYRWHLARATAQRDAAGRVLQWVGTVTDVHAQQTAARRQRHHQRREQRLLAHLDQLPLYLVTTQGPQHHISYLSAAARPFLPPDALGQPAGHLLPDTGPAASAVLDDVFQTGEARHLGLTPFYAPQTPDAPPRQLDVTVLPLRGHDGLVAGLLMAGLDITQRLAAEQQVAAVLQETQRQQEQFRFLTEFIPQQVWTADATGQPTYANQRWRDFTGLENAALQAWFADKSFIHPDDAAAIQAQWQQCIGTGQPLEAEYRMRRHDGQFRWMLVQAQALRDVEGRITKWFGTCTEIEAQKQLLQQLAAKDAQQRRILDQLPSYIATYEGPELRLSYLSPNHGELLGGPRAQVGQTLREAAPELADQGLEALLRQVQQTGRPHLAFEQPLDFAEPATGQLRRRYLNFGYYPLAGPDGGPTTGILAFAQDVTAQVRERQKAEELQGKVHRRDQRLRLMAESLPLISHISSADGETTEYISPQWFAYTGQDPATLDNNSIGAAIHPDDIAPFIAAFQQGQQQQAQWHTELRLRCHDGEYRWHLSRSLPELDAATGQILRWYGSTLDIHEAKLLRDELQASEQQFRFLAESVPQITWTADHEGRVEYFNQRLEEATGLRPVDCLGPEAWSNIVHPDDQARALKAWRQAVEQHQPYEIEYRVVARTGGYRWFLVRAEPLRDAATGEVLRWFGSCTDIDDFKRASQHLERQNAQLIRTNEDLDNFVYTASHDLKQPINNMAGIFEELTRTAYFRDPDAVRLISYFERALTQIYGTIEGLSDIVQLQRQHREASPDDVALAPLVADIINSMQDQVTQLGATFDLDFATRPTVSFVRPHLQSILFNLISNALKYAAPGRPPRIRLSCAPEGSATGGSVITVQDNGLGIDLERYRPQLFQLFRRFHTHVEGSGMGLYLVNRLVQNHGGELEVESTLGEGTTFRIYLH